MPSFPPGNPWTGNLAHHEVPRTGALVEGTLRCSVVDVSLNFSHQRYLWKHKKMFPLAKNFRKVTSGIYNFHPPPPPQKKKVACQLEGKCFLSLITEKGHNLKPSTKVARWRFCLGTWHGGGCRNVTSMVVEGSDEVSGGWASHLQKNRGQTGSVHQRGVKI